MSLKILQINLHHCKAASAALLLRLAGNGADIALIQEPWIVGGKVSGLRAPEYKLVVAESQGNIRTCILARKHLSIFLLHSFSNEDNTAVSLELQSAPIRLLSCYMAYDQPGPPPEDITRRLVNDCVTNNIGLLIGCDVNAHHTQWGSTNINKRGELLLDYILTTNLEVLNRGNDPTFVIKDRKEVIDLTLASHSISDLINNWKVSSEHSFSDHRYIEFVLNLSHSTPPPFYNLRKTDWSKYQALLRDYIPETAPNGVHSVRRLHGLIKTFTKACNSAGKAACPISRPKKNKKPPWWSQNLGNLRRSCRALFNQAKASNTEQSWTNYKLHLALYKKELRRAKRSSWRSFCSDIESTSEAARLRTILSKSTPSLGYLKKEDDTWTTSSEESLDALLTKHFPGCRQQKTDNLISPQEVPLGPSLLSLHNINWAINSFKPFKSPGPDGISPAHLQHAGSIATNWLQAIFLEVFKTGYIPDPWRLSKIVFIPKAGKASHVSPKDFRPISLTSFLLKTFERILSLYLRVSIPTEFISSSQHAYRKGRSTETALHSVVATIEKSLSSKEYTLIAFLDIEGAFNNVLPEAITEALTNLGIENRLVGLISQLLTCRAVTSTLGSSTLTRYVSRGTPQGGVLSPLLWNLVVNRLLCDIEGGGCQLVAYADDVAMIFTGKYPQTLCDLMTVKLSNLAAWADKCGLGVNPDKTELVLFTRRYKVPTLIPPKLKDSALSFSDSAKYLGLVLDKKLDWNQSTHDRCRKATIALYTCRKAIGIKWGMSPYIVRWLYTAIIRPILLYGILVWWPALSKQSIKKQINKVQRMAEICITGALNTTPNDALDVILNFPPIQQTSQAVATLAAIRIRDTNNWGDFHSGHSLILKENAIFSPKTDCCVPTEHVTTPFNVLIPRREDWITEPPGHSNALSFYTDGSKLNNQVGGGVFSQKLCINHSFRLPDHCSVFQAEILAINEALIFLKKSRASPGKINIYSDSQAAIKSIASTTSKSTSVSKCRRSIHEMAELFDICLVWVPGHQDIQGNCIADELARRGTTDTLLPDKEGISMPLATCKLMLHNLFEEKHNVQWYSTPNCRVARQTWPHIDKARSKALCSLSRTDCSRVVRSITGHWLVGIHALRLKAPYNDFCRSCRDEEEEESPEHFFCFCPALSNRRRRALGKPFLTSLCELATLAPSRIALFVRLSNWAPF